VYVHIEFWTISDWRIINVIILRADGRISDIFGRKSAYLFAQAAFVVGSVLCGMAPNLEFLIVARIVAGIGGGGLNTMSSVITSDLVTLRERGVYQGYANTAFACGGTLGAPLGGWITERIGWRYCFYINLPLCLIATYLTGSLQNYNLHVEGDGSYHFIEKLKKVDYAGAFSLVSAIICIILATTYGGNAVPWSHPLIIAGFVGFGAMLGIFILVESCWAKLPVLPMRLMAMRNPALCSLTNFFSMMASTAMVYFSPLFFVAIMGFSSSKAGFWVSARVVGVSLGSLTAGKYMSHYGRFKPYLVMTYFFLSVAMLGISSWTASTPPYIQVGAMLLDGFSAGGGLTTSLVAMLSSVDPEGMCFGSLHLLLIACTKICITRHCDYRKYLIPFSIHWLGHWCLACLHCVSKQTQAISRTVNYRT
jgi:MFS family permease